MGSGVPPSEITTIKSLSYYQTITKQTKKGGTPGGFLFNLFCGSVTLRYEQVDLPDESDRAVCGHDTAPTFPAEI